MKKLIIILSLFSGSLFAQYTFSYEQMLKFATWHENSIYYYSKDSVSSLQIEQYKIIVHNQSKVIVNQNKINNKIQLNLDECRKKKNTYKFIAIGAGVLVGILVIRE